MPAAPPRYLVAYPYPVARGPDRLAILRFPPGVTLEDAGHGYWDPHDTPVLPAETVERLHGLGVEIVAVGLGIWAAFDTLRDASAPRSSLGAFAEDYLDANARLGEEQCVSVREYAMDTYLDHQPLAGVLRDWLPHMGGVRVYGDAAFRKGKLPDVLRLRAWNIARYELWRQRRLFVPCRLHGDGCRGYPRGIAEFPEPYAGVSDALDARHRGARVAVPRSLLDGLRRGPGPARRRTAREIVQLLLDSLPEGAWSGDAWKPSGFDAVVAAAVAETCEEYEMLLRALRKCRSPRQMVRRSRDASWAVSRALEGLRDGQ